jgi:hypothetical protein
MAAPRGQRAAALSNQTGHIRLLHNPYQAAFFAALDARQPDGSPEFSILSLFAGRRGGKTKAGGVAVPKLVARKPNQLGWVCAPTYRDLYDFVRPEVLGAIPSGWVKDWNETHLTLELVNNNRVQFRSLEDPNTARGPGLDWCWIDEARKVQQLAYKTMLPALADKEGVLVVTTSPNGYDWCYDDFWVPAEGGEPGFWACKYKTLDNPHMNTPSRRAIIERHRRLMDPLFFAQEYEADFVSFSGAIYGNVLTPDLEFKTDEDCRRWIPEWPRLHPGRRVLVGMDPGADHPFAVVLLTPTPYGLVQVGEYKARYKTIEQHWSNVQALLHALCPTGALEIDTIAIDKSQRQTMIEFNQQTGLIAQAAVNDVVPGIRRVQAWMGGKTLRFAPGRCADTLKDLRSYRWAEDTNAKGEMTSERVVKINDDLPDALRYLLMTWPELPTDYEEAVDVLPSDPDDPYAWVRERMRRTNALETELESADAALFAPGEPGASFAEFFA